MESFKQFLPGFPGFLQRFYTIITHRILFGNCPGVLFRNSAMISLGSSVGIPSQILAGIPQPFFSAITPKISPEILSEITGISSRILSIIPSGISIGITLGIFSEITPQIDARASA